MKKVFSFILCSIIVFSLCGCSMGNKSGSDDTAQITIYDQNSTFSGKVDGWFADILKEKFGAELSFRASSDYGFSAYVEQGFLGDIIIFSNEYDYRLVQEAGLLFDWEQHDILSTYAPYIAENLTDALEKNRLMNADNGIYGINGDISSSGSGHTDFTDVTYIRWDLYARLGYPEINTLEDLIPVLTDMTEMAREDSPSQNIYAVSSFTSWDNKMLNMVSSTASLYGYREFGLGLYNPDTDSYEECIDRDGIYIRCLKFYNALNRAGLIDPNSSSQSYDYAKVNYERGNAIFGLFDYITGGFNTDANMEAGKCMMPIAAKDFSNLCIQDSIYGSDYVWTIGSTSKNPEICMEIINWLFTPEGALTDLYGPIGTTWDYDSNGNPYLTEFGYTCLSNTATPMPEGYNGTFEGGMIQFVCPTWNENTTIPGADVSFNYMTWESTLNSSWYKDNYGSYEASLSEWSSYTNAATVNEYIESNGYTVWPSTTYSAKDISQDYVISENEIGNLIKTYSWQAIAAESDAEFDSIISELITKCNEKEQYDDIVNFYISELDRFKESMK